MQKGALGRNAVKKPYYGPEKIGCVWVYVSGRVSVVWKVYEGLWEYQLVFGS